MFSKSKTDFISDTYDHLWRTAAATPPKGRIPGDVRTVITRSMSTPKIDNVHTASSNQSADQLQFRRN